MQENTDSNNVAMRDDDVILKADALANVEIHWIPRSYTSKMKTEGRWVTCCYGYSCLTSLLP